MKVIDLNCDLGEGEHRQRTRALMRRVTSINVACGGHAGDDASMRFCVDQALAMGVRIGAHPGFPDRRNFGRTPAKLNASDLKGLLAEQVSRLARMTAERRGRLHHMKLHGALYHVVEESDALARSYVQWVGKSYPGLRIIGKAGGRVVRQARRFGVPVWNEVFVDRGYDGSGGLIPRNQRGAMLTSREEVVVRVLGILQEGCVTSADGGKIPIEADTLCVHGDSPGSLQVASWVVKTVQSVEGSVVKPGGGNGAGSRRAPSSRW